MDFSLDSFVLFILGYLVGRIDALYRFLIKKQERKVEESNINSTSSKKLTKNIINANNTQNIKPPKITIDESKFVTTIKTDSFQKDFEALGETTTSEDDIKSSISKLSRLKKK